MRAGRDAGTVSRARFAGFILNRSSFCSLFQSGRAYSTAAITERACSRSIHHLMMVPRPTELSATDRSLSVCSDASLASSSIVGSTYAQLVWRTERDSVGLVPRVTFGRASGESSLCIGSQR